MSELQSGSVANVFASLKSMNSSAVKSAGWSDLAGPTWLDRATGCDEDAPRNREHFGNKSMNFYLIRQNEFAEFEVIPLESRKNETFKNANLARILRGDRRTTKNREIHLNGSLPLRRASTTGSLLKPFEALAKRT